MDSILTYLLDTISIFCEQDLIDIGIRTGYYISGTLWEVGHG